MGALIFKPKRSQSITDSMNDISTIFLKCKCCISEGEKPETKQKRLEAKYAALQIVQNVDKYGTAKQGQLSREGDLLTRERLCCGLSLFSVVLRRLRTCLSAPQWPAPPAPHHHAPAHTDDTNEFHRLWSALQFLYCIPVGDTQFTVE
ncbi:hypothetical protein HF086_014226 [Spodoptera exigua]|uniref:Uncharacterized protein n=1 Tax=Spodoptera exigua TaxID=7107 RepID=A0A922MIT8_SPOEX|nr:hypothetical protein HF086_014226 [Spodoptera exigua]